MITANPTTLTAKGRTPTASDVPLQIPAERGIQMPDSSYRFPDVRLELESMQVGESKGGPHWMESRMRQQACRASRFGRRYRVVILQHEIRVWRKA